MTRCGCSCSFWLFKGRRHISADIHSLNYCVHATIGKYFFFLFFFFNNFCRFASILSFVRVCWVLNLFFENIEFNKWRVFEALIERRLQLRFHDEILTTSLFVDNSIIFMNRFFVLNILLQQRIWQCRVVQCVMKHWESCGMLQIHLFGTFRLSPGELVYC